MIEITKDLNYEKNNIGYDSQYPDGGIKCKNYELCNAVLPYWWWDCKGCYLCTNCDMMFGTWTTKLGGGNNGKGILEFIVSLTINWCDSISFKNIINKGTSSHNNFVEPIINFFNL